MGLCFSTVVGAATGLAVKSEAGQNAMRKFAETSIGERVLARLEDTTVGQDVKTFLKDGDKVNINRAAATAGVAAGVGTQLITLVTRVFRRHP